MSISSQKIQTLFTNQLETWEQAKGNYSALKAVESRDFLFDKFSIRVQFNPARIQSSAAKVDTKSIQERKCFLCPANLPTVQTSIPFGEDYQVLVNPFPIFPTHFTIPTYKHIDQLIFDRFGDMLDLAKELDNYTIFYNGPKCGASAPDHAHFQAGVKGFLPLEQDMLNITKESIYQSEGLTVYTVNEYLRNLFLIEATDKQEAILFFKKLYNLFDLKDDDKEPMMNILTWYENERWYSAIFPRKKHRPDCFYAEGDDNMLISPAAVDLGGVFITPLEKDFNKITAEDIKTILKEICIDDEKMQTIINMIKERQ
ncbi:DUF4922 domain-containing protein [Dysgonomonas sp. Marseille-P4677]|uniref:DUF4922 domain-containing protein n=1 Tax=Dysgonomonas sp. Marseille-P4677 TaxID=2364790 RepID=UPI001914D594|nr:DUF4922 domain-containing protein [Dysgonomonas sp. Marseille-P4677]MBK5721576.1 DUF4922 domain-containing protein [Dysgonomonas sp. Marseille-P4677]